MSGDSLYSMFDAQHDSATGHRLLGWGRPDLNAFQQSRSVVIG
jgi:hypothetical protein